MAELHILGGLSTCSPSPERLRVSPVSLGLKALPRLSAPQNAQGPYEAGKGLLLFR